MPLYSIFSRMVLQPCDMAVAAVDRQADQFAVQRPELLGTRPESEYFGGADRGEIGRVAEKNHPFALVIVREADLPLGGHGLECRNRLAEPRHLLFVLFHKSEFLKVYTRTCKVDALPEFIFQDTEFAGTLSADFPPHTEAYTQTAFSDRRNGISGLLNKIKRTSDFIPPERFVYLREEPLNP